jgi:3-phosphoshikimate 1-carboxyvinyltransferase
VSDAPVAPPRVAILGLGMIGGSLALALREAGAVAAIWASDPDAEALRCGLEMGVIDRALDSPEAALDAEIAVVCAPPAAAAGLLADLCATAARTGAGTVLTDVASVKGELETVLRRECGEVPSQVVLGHPIAGSERRGVAAAQAALFRDHLTILTPLANTDAAALAAVRALWRAVGAEVVSMPVTTHDRVLAATSHLPHVLAYALVDTLARSAHSDDIFRFAAGGFRDFTRIASSDPVMWRDIALANREALLEAIDAFDSHLAVLRAAIAAGDGEALLQTFTSAKAARDGFARRLAAQRPA